MFEEITLPANLPPTDYYHVNDLLRPEERTLRDRVRQWVDREVIPIVEHYWDRAEFPFEIIPKMRELGIVGGPIRGYGSSPRNSHAATQASRRSTASTPASRWARSRSSAPGSSASGGCPRWRVWRRSARSRSRSRRTDRIRSPSRRRLVATEVPGCSAARRSGSATRRSPTSSWCGRATRPGTWVGSSSKRARRTFTRASSRARSPSGPCGRRRSCSTTCGSRSRTGSSGRARSRTRERF